MTGFTRLIVVFSLFIPLTFSMEDNANTTTTISLNDNSVSTISNRDVPYRIYKFPQKLSHHVVINNSKKWNQKYFIVDRYFKNKKKMPRVFLRIGGEDPIVSDHVQNAKWIEWAIKFKALCFVLEHRFYGFSQPTFNTNTESLREYLNVGQALADLAYFIESMNEDWKLKDRSPKWILFGGSYPGLLAALMQKRYSHLVAGAVASSATFPTKPFLPEIYERVGYAIKDYDDKNSHGDSTCYDNIEEGFYDLNMKISSGDLEICNQVKKTFHLDPDGFNCTNHLQVSLLFQQLAANIYFIFPDKEKLHTFCRLINTRSRSKMVALAIGFENVYPDIFGHDKIYAIDYENTINNYKKSDLDNVNDVRQWLYQQCTELGGIETSDSPNQPFGNRFGSEFQLRCFCTDVFGPDYNLEMVTKGVENVINEYGGKEDFYDKTIFTIGQFDATLEEQMEIYNSAGNQVILIEGAFHCDDMTSSGPKTSKELGKVHKKIEKFIDQWVNAK